jgi:hypothetical protein
MLPVRGNILRQAQDEVEFAERRRHFGRNDVSKHGPEGTRAAHMLRDGPRASSA